MPFPQNFWLLAGVVALPTLSFAQSDSSPATAPKSVPDAGRAQAPVKPTAKAVDPKKAGRVVRLEMAEGLRFDPPRFEAKAGELLQLQLENVDPSHLAHNLVVVAPGQVQEVVKQAMEMGEAGPNQAFVPKHPAIIAASSKLVDPEKKLQVRFTVPSEPGVYGYVCTVPGHGMVMYGAMYVDVPPPPLAKDPNIPQLTLEKGLVGGGKRPFVQRMFVPDAGPAAIAVALNGTQNYCFDAGNCRLRFVWDGPFLDASAHFRGNGARLADLGNDPWWMGNAFPLRFGDAQSVPKTLQFLGYQVEDGIPEFRYRAGQQEVFQRVLPSEKGISIRFRLPGVKGKVFFVGDSAEQWSSPAGSFKKGVLEVPSAKAAEFEVSLEPGATPPRSKTSHEHRPASPNP